MCTYHIYTLPQVCAADMSKAVSSSEVDSVLRRLGESTCSMLEYGALRDIAIVPDAEPEENVRYVDMVAPMGGGGDKASGAGFVDVPCKGREVVYPLNGHYLNVMMPDGIIPELFHCLVS